MVEFHLNGFCCWLWQHVLQGVGTVPSAACGPTQGSTLPAAGRGLLEQFGSCLVGVAGKGLGATPEAGHPGYRESGVSSSSAPIKVGGSEAKILSPLALDPGSVSRSGSAAPALRSD